MTQKKRKGFVFTKDDFSKENVIEGALLRPLLLLLSFFAFIVAMFLLVMGVGGSRSALGWGGSLILFAFVVNIYAIYLSLTDEPSVYRNLNLVFKLVLFTAEIVAFNYVLLLVL